MTRDSRDDNACSVTDVGPGDFVKVNGQWKEIESNTAAGSPYTPRYWTVETKDGLKYGMFSIQRYAKKDDSKK